MAGSENECGSVDREMMGRCIALSQASHADGEYPFGAVVAREGVVVAEGTNHIARNTDVTRHAEIVALAAAQARLATTSLADCTLYVNAEPCAMCSFAVRESRIRRVVFALASPHMGGLHKWNILGDEDLSRALPEVYAPPPEIVAGFMAEEAAEALARAEPLIWRMMASMEALQEPNTGPRVARRDDRGAMAPVMGWLRRAVFDRFGRR